MDVGITPEDLPAATVSVSLGCAHDIAVRSKDKISGRHRRLVLLPSGPCKDHSRAPDRLNRVKGSVKGEHHENGGGA
jgi:hypothetical protein